MFKLFKKNKPAPDTPKVCRHVWKDFPWYTEEVYYTDTNRFELKVIEPYVCIHCKERKNVVLKELSLNSITTKGAGKTLTQIQEKYADELMDRAYVEDMIADAQLIDREKLALYESIINPPKNDLESEMESLIKDVKQGKLPSVGVCVERH